MPNTVSIYNSQTFTAPGLGSATYQNPVLVDCSSFSSSTGKLFLNVTAVTGTTAPGPNAVVNFRFTFSSVNTYNPSTSAAILALAQTVPIRLPNTVSTTLEIPPVMDIEFVGPYMYVWCDLANVLGNFTLSATAYTPTAASGGGGGSNASVGITGSAAPGSATELGFISGGNLVGVSGSNPLPITGSISATNPSVGTNSAAAPTSSTQVGFLSGSNLVNVSSTNPLPSSASLTATADSAPATQNITTQDLVVTSTAGANGQLFYTGTPTTGSAASFACAGYETAEVQVTGTWTGTLQTEITIDGVNWFTRGIKQSGSTYISSSFTGNFEGGCNISTITNFRIRATSAITGTAVVKIILSVNNNSITITNALSLRDATTQSITSAIKAASTAATATDNSFVVALSPNSPLPTGTNNVGSITNVTGTLSLPTGAATSALQTTANTSLATIATNTTQLVTDSAAATLSVNNNTLNVNTTNYGGITFQVTAISGTLNLNASVDGVQTTVPFFAVPVAGGAAVSAITTTGMFQADVTAIDQIKFQSTGTATVVYVLSTGGSVVTVDNFPATTGANNADAVATVSTGLSTSVGFGYVWNGSTWDRQREVVGDAQNAAGITAATGMMWNGTAYDRIKSSGKLGAQDVNLQSPVNSIQALVLSPLTSNSFSSVGSTGSAQVVPGAWYAFSVSKIYTANTVTFTATGGASGQATITTASTTGIAAGQQITGTGVSVGALVVSVVANTSVTLSVNLTATASGTYTCTSDQFVFTSQSSPDNSTWSNLSAQYRGVPALQAPASTQYYAGLYWVQAPLTTSGNCYLRLNITTLTNVTVQVFFDALTLGSKIRIGQCYPSAFTQAFWPTGACAMPLTDTCLLGAFQMEQNAFSGTSQTMTPLQSSDPNTSYTDGVFVIGEAIGSPTGGVALWTYPGIFQIGFKAQYGLIKQTGTALTAWTSGSPTAIVGALDAPAVLDAYLAGNVTAGTTPTSNPLRVGVVAQSAAPTARTNGTLVDPAADTVGNLGVQPYSVPALAWQYTSGTAGITATGSNAAKAAGAAGIRNYVTGIQVTSTSTTASNIQILDGATVIWVGQMGASDNKLLAVEFLRPLAGTAATALNVGIGTAATGGTFLINLQGYQAP